MRMICQAVRAVTVEVMGVGVVVFMLFSAVGWTVESAGVKPKQDVDRVWNWLRVTTEDAAASFKPSLSDEQREQFAGERLDYYGKLYGTAAGKYANQAAHQLLSADQEPSLPTNQLLGTL